MLSELVVALTGGRIEETGRRGGEMHLVFTSEHIIVTHSYVHFWLRQELKKCNCPSVCSVKVYLELSIFIFLTQVCLWSVLGLFRFIL